MTRQISRPRSPKAVIAQAGKLISSGNLPAAIAELERALASSDSRDDIRFALGNAWLEAGEAERALNALTQITDAEFAARAAIPIARANTMLGAHRAPANYVRHLFDQFAADYDAHMLGDLQYRAPMILRGLADMVLQPAKKQLDILDLGCGTGLGGEAFKDLAARMEGIDLSPRMIEKARARGVYDALSIADLETAMAAPGASYDLILAADVLVYFGDLAGVLKAVHSALNCDGFFLFTVEQKAGDGYELGPKRRYRHSKAYLHSETERAGLEVMGLVECTPRYDAGEAVSGFAVALLRQ